MATAVELPSEANPLNPQLLFKTLQAAASSDPQQIQTAAQQLQNWEKQRGYYSLLQEIFIDRSLPLDIRYIAIIQLKNGIDKYWRRTATNVLHKEEKNLIRSQLLLSGIEEADRRLALQNALVTAKVVRFDYPNEWPDVITTLIFHLRSATQPGSNALLLPRALLILLYIIKELSTARLQRSRASLQSTTPEIFYVLCEVYANKVHSWRAFLENGGEDEGGALDAIDQTLMMIKILRRLLIAGYEFPNRDKHVREFWIMAKNQFGDFLSIVTREPRVLSPQVQELLEKHLLQMSKLHVDMARVNPAAFALLPESILLVKAYWGLISQLGQTYLSESPSMNGNLKSAGDADDDEKPLLEKLSLKGLLLLRACVKMVFSPSKSFKYRHQEERDEQRQAADIMRGELLTEDVVRGIMEVIVTRLFIFRENDLREWNEEPEEWERRGENEGDGWEFSVRPCAEKLFLDLMINFKELLIPPMLEVFYTVSNSQNNDILFKDSVYTAIGLSASVLHQHLDFESFLKSKLVAEVQESRPGYNILRRRIAILLGEWVSIRIPKENRLLVYQIFQHLLNKDDPLNDQVVRVTAGKQFRNVADEWEFDPKAFLPYASPILSRIMSLIEEVELTDTKMALLNTISVIVERMDYHITPFAENIVFLLPLLWEQSGQEHLLKQAILTILTRLVNSMKDESRQYHPIVLPLIKHAVDPTLGMQVYLLEDALELWAAILVQTVDSAASAVLFLAPYLFSIFELGSENLRKALEIIESYVMLAPREILDTDMRDQILRVFASLLGTLKAEANGVVTHVVEVMICEAELIGGEQAVAVVASAIVESGLLGKVLEALKGSWEAHQTSGPNRKTAVVDGVVETDFFSILARLVLANPRTFLSLLQSLEASRSESVEQTMNWLLGEWFAHFENIGHPPHRKLNCLALTSLLQLSVPWVLGRLQDLMNIWTDMITEVQEGVDVEGGDNLIFHDMAGNDSGRPEAPEDHRRRKLTFSDPVRRINTTDFIRQHLQWAVTESGGQERFTQEWLVNVDADVINSFGRLGVL